MESPANLAGSTAASLAAELGSVEPAGRGCDCGLAVFFFLCRRLLALLCGFLGVEPGGLRLFGDVGAPSPPAAGICAR
eukprot:SAG31_NODE_32496_length_355_cov_0.796875_1_plen_77_part_01